MLRAVICLCLMLVRILKKSPGCLVRLRVWLICYDFRIKASDYNLILTSFCFQLLFWFWNVQICHFVLLVSRADTICHLLASGEYSGGSVFGWWGGWLQIILNFRFFCCLTSYCVQDGIRFAGRYMTLTFFPLYSWQIMLF